MSIKPSHLFLADVHFGAKYLDNKTVESKLIQLIQYCTENAVKLYILGDLFDYWMEYPKNNFVPDFANNILDAFEEYNHKVGAAIYITGNHDNWTYGHFTNRGFLVESEYKIITLGKYKVLLMHGDGLFNKNQIISRPLGHRLLRNKAFLKIFQFVLPPKAGLSVMKNFSALTVKKPGRSSSKLSNNAATIINDANTDIDVVFSGHDHIERIEKIGNGYYINPGAFHKNNTVAIYNNNTFKLVKWLSEKKELISL